MGKGGMAITVQALKPLDPAAEQQRQQQHAVGYVQYDPSLCGCGGMTRARIVH